MTLVHVVTAKLEGRGPVPATLCGSPLRDIYVRTLTGIGKESSHVCPRCLAIARQQGSGPPPESGPTH